MTGTPINFRPIAGTRLFRSSQPEDAATSKVFKSAGIKTILDLRDLSEVSKSPACCDYKQYIVQPLVNPDEESPQMKSMPHNSNKNQVNPDGLYHGVHAVLSLFQKRLLLKEAGWRKICILIAYFIDMILCTKLAQTLTIRLVLNRHKDRSLAWLYQNIIEGEGKNINAALRLLAEPSHTPAVVICTLGKDRTGITCMLAGHVCGQSEEQLCQEYAVTDEKYQSNPDHFLLQTFVKLKVHDCFKYAKKETMQGLIDYIKLRHGSIDKYLDSIGFGAQSRERLRKNIIAEQQEN